MVVSSYVLSVHGYNLKVGSHQATRRISTKLFCCVASYSRLHQATRLIKTGSSHRWRVHTMRRNSTKLFRWVESRRKPVFWCEHPYDSRQPMRDCYGWFFVQSQDSEHFSCSQSSPVASRLSVRTCWRLRPGTNIARVMQPDDCNQSAFAIACCMCVMKLFIDLAYSSTSGVFCTDEDLCWYTCHGA